MKTKKTKPAARKPRTPAKPGTNGSREFWRLRLYVAGQTARSLAAFANLKGICDEFLPGRHTIEVIDLVTSPELGRSDQIIALPTLVRKLPEPVKRIIGDLSNSDRVKLAIELFPEGLAS
ncbi:MAG: KaiB domain protein [Lacunisphaera sp.]|nr:KaiB domain protein [Lacunisphaera sp.]